jgi:hypothetical protein
MLETLARLGEFLGGTAVIAGVVFAVIQLRHRREERQREVALELLHSFQTVDFAKALHILDSLPDGLSKREIEDRVGDEFGLIYALMGTWESIGILVFRREIRLDLIDDFFSGSISMCWQKLGVAVADDRKHGERDTRWEWFQWLAERMMERESATPPVPAHIEHSEWKPEP